MNTTKKIVLSLAALLVISPLSYGEDLLSSLFGKSKDNNNFSKIMSHVPADTAYLYTNKKTLPESFIQFHLEHYVKAINSIELMNKEASANQQPDISKVQTEKSKVKYFYDTILDEILTSLKKGNLDDTGISFASNFALYENNLSPTLRIAPLNKSKFMAFIQRAEKKSGHTVTFDKCMNNDCLLIEGKPGELGIMVILLSDHLSISLFQPNKKKEVMEYLVGLKKPENSYSTENWNKFITDNKYTGYAEGFIDFKKLYPKIVSFNPKKHNNASPSLTEENKSCLKVVEDHLAYVPGVIFGITKLVEKSVEMNFILQTKDEVNSILQNLTNANGIKQRRIDPIFDYGINIDIEKLKPALQKYSEFLIQSSEKHQCTSVKSDDIKKSIAALSMFTFPIEYLYVSITQLAVAGLESPNTNKPPIEAYGVIGSNNPGALLNMLKLFVPPLANINLPSNGETVKLPATIAPQLMGSEILLNHNPNSIKIMIGNDQPALKDYQAKNTEIITVGIDMEKYYKALFSFLPKPKDKGEKNILEFMLLHGVQPPAFAEYSIYADEPGLVFSGKINYK